MSRAGQAPIVLSVSRLPTRGKAASVTRARTTLPGSLIGIGVAGTLDEVILHQLLRWHHFYDRSTSAIGMISDGIFHALSTALLAGGLIVLSKRRAMLARGWGRSLMGWILVGAGGFNLYDGTIQHKVLGLHQVRRGADDLVPYDLTFIGIAVATAAIGLLILGRAPPRAE
jgi:uncharacterized membrane protein